MALKLYEPTPEEELTLTKPEYYQINKNKFAIENNLFLENKFVFESRSEVKETPAFITKQGYVVVEDWDLLFESFDNALMGEKIYISIEGYEVPIFLGIDTIDNTSCILAYHPQVEYEPHIKKMVEKLEEQGYMADFENYNTLNKKIENKPKVK